MDTDIHVVINRLDLSDNHNKHAGATIASVLENSSKPITFHITHDGDKSYKNIDETNSNIAKYQELVAKYHSKIEFHDLQDFEWDKRIPKSVIKKWPSICLSRLHFQEIFPNIDRILLLGTDTIVNTDISKLISLCPKNKSIAGVHDAGIETYYKNYRMYQKYVQKSGIDVKTYINSDVLVYNLKKIRDDNCLMVNVVRYLGMYGLPSLNEQDIINLVFKGDIFHLPEQYNIFASDVLETIDDNAKKNDYIIHFAGRFKPHEYYMNKYYLEYWKYLALTPWANGKSAYTLIGENLPTPHDIINNLEKYLISYPVKEIPLIVLKITCCTWFKMIIPFMRYLKIRNNKNPKV